MKENYISGTKVNSLTSSCKRKSSVLQEIIKTYTKTVTTRNWDYLFEVVLFRGNCFNNISNTQFTLTLPVSKMTFISSFFPFWHWVLRRLMSNTCGAKIFFLGKQSDGFRVKNHISRIEHFVETRRNILLRINKKWSRLVSTFKSWKNLLMFFSVDVDKYRRSIPIYVHNMMIYIWLYTRLDIYIYISEMNNIDNIGLVLAMLYTKLKISRWVVSASS